MDLLEATKWQEQGACVGLDFFIEDGRLGDKRTVCKVCSVQDTCLNWALDCEDTSPVVWGGTTGNQRKKML
jgi:hypothetical protein